MKKLLIVVLLVILAGAILFLVKSQSKQSPTIYTQISPTPTETLATEIPLTITQPKNGIVVSTPTITVAGTTVPNASVFVNEKELKADAKGAFSTSITLDEGDNDIFIAAHDEDGNYAEAELTITLESTQ